MKKLSQITTYIIIIFIMMFSVFSITYAQEKDYTVLVPLPGIGDTTGKTTLETYLPKMFNLTIGIASVLAFIMIVWGGVTYATSDALNEKAEGRGIIENAVYGLVLVIGAYLILQTINPQILNFTLLLPRSNITAPEGSIIPGTGTCSGCTTFSTLGIPTNASASGSSVAGSMGGKLVSLKQILQSGGLPSGTWYISEGYPPTVVHKDPCHAIGTCVDVNISNPTIGNIRAFMISAQKAGISSVYEVTSVAELNRLATQVGPSARIVNNSFSLGGGVVQLNSGASAAHFHIK